MSTLHMVPAAPRCSVYIWKRRPYQVRKPRGSSASSTSGAATYSLQLLKLDLIRHVFNDSLVRQLAFPFSFLVVVWCRPHSFRIQFNNERCRAFEICMQRVLTRALNVHYAAYHCQVRPVLLSVAFDH